MIENRLQLPDLQQVALGTRGDGKAPVLEEHADVGVGTKLLGGIVVDADIEGW